MNHRKSLKSYLLWPQFDVEEEVEPYEVQQLEPKGKNNIYIRNIIYEKGTFNFCDQSNEIPIVTGKTLCQFIYIAFNISRNRDFPIFRSIAEPQIFVIRLPCTKRTCRRKPISSEQN